MKKAFRLVPLAVAMLMSAGIAHAADTIKIAAAVPLTGPVTQYGDMVREGVQTAIDYYNDHGGVLGKKLEMVAVDDACEPKQGPIAANNVVNQKIGFVVGHVCSGATLGAAPIYDDQGVVMITPSATSPAVTDGKNYHYIFRSTGRDDQQGPVAAEYILSVNKATPLTVAVLHDKQSYGQGIAESVKKTLEKGGVKPVVFEGVNAGESDYSSVITKLKSKGVNFVYYGGYHPELGLLIRQAAEQGMKVQFMGPDGAGNTQINAIAGKAVEGMLVTLFADYSKNPENAAIVKFFKDKKRNPSGAFQFTSYAATQAMVEAMKAVKSDDTTKVADYLHANTVNTVLGPLSWDKKGDLTKFKFEIYKWHTDGSKTLVQ